MKPERPLGPSPPRAREINGVRPVNRAVLSNVYFRAVTLAGILLAVWLWIQPTTPLAFDSWVFWAMLALGIDFAHLAEDAGHA